MVADLDELKEGVTARGGRPQQARHQPPGRGAGQEGAGGAGQGGLEVQLQLGGVAPGPVNTCRRHMGWFVFLTEPYRIPR